MIANVIATVLVILAAIPATIFPLLYSRSPWRETLIGRALMTSTVGLALLVDISLLYKVFGDEYFARDVVRLVVYFIITAGAYLNLWALLGARRRHHPDIEHIS